MKGHRSTGSNATAGVASVSRRAAPRRWRARPRSGARRSTDARPPRAGRRPGSLPHPRLRGHRHPPADRAHHRADDGEPLSTTISGCRTATASGCGTACPGGQSRRERRSRLGVHMPSTCQLDGHPGQNWNASHSHDHGRNDGFVRERARRHGPDGDDLPFYYALASTFTVRPLVRVVPGADVSEPPLSAGGRRHRQRRSTRSPRRLRPTATSWSGSTRTGSRGGTTTSTCPASASSSTTRWPTSRTSPVAQYFTDAAAGTLPSVSFVDPLRGAVGREPQDIQAGEDFAARVINAAMAGPAGPHGSRLVP